jgi:hypothetical protein
MTKIISNIKTGHIYWTNFQTRLGPSSGTANVLCMVVYYLQNSLFWKKINEWVKGIFSICSYITYVFIIIIINYSVVQGLLGNLFFNFRFSAITTRFMELDLEKDDLSSFLKDFVLPTSQGIVWCLHTKPREITSCVVHVPVHYCIIINLEEMDMIKLMNHFWLFTFWVTRNFYPRELCRWQILIGFLIML